jgi:hypothetical protein
MLPRCRFAKLPAIFFAVLPTIYRNPNRFARPFRLPAINIAKSPNCQIAGNFIKRSFFDPPEVGR